MVGVGRRLLVGATVVAAIVGLTATAPAAAASGSDPAEDPPSTTVELEEGGSGGVALPYSVWDEDSQQGKLFRADGSQVTGFDRHAAGVGEAADGGSLVFTYGPKGGPISLVRIGPDGKRTTFDTGTSPDFTGFDLSADGRRIAWVNCADGCRAHVADAVTGERLAESPKTPVEMNLGAFSADELVLTSRVQLYRWRIGGEKIERFGSEGYLGSVGAVSDDGGLIARTIAGANDDADTCSEVVDREGVQKWRRCGLLVRDFSPDGRFALAQPSGGAYYRRVDLLDARTGKTVRRFVTDEGGYFRFDLRGDIVMLETEDDKTRSGLVTCTVRGECRTATPIGTGTLHYTLWSAFQRMT